MSQSSCVIFYTDDDADDQFFFKEIVGEIQPQCAIYTQNDGIELLTVLQNPPPEPSLVFLDLNMPKKSGYEVLKELRETHKAKSVPVIIFSTSNDERAIETTKALGASMYVIKPTSYTDFKRLMRSVLALDWQQPSLPEDKFVFSLNP